MKTEINNKIFAYKFSNTAREKPIFKETIKDFLNKIMNDQFRFGYHNLKDSGRYKLLGWSFDFSPHLKKYVYKDSGGIHEGYFLNKTNCRKMAYGKIQYIKEI